MIKNDKRKVYRDISEIIEAYLNYIDYNIEVNYHNFFTNNIIVSSKEKDLIDMLLSSKNLNYKCMLAQLYMSSDDEQISIKGYELLKNNAVNGHLYSILYTGINALDIYGYHERSLNTKKLNKAFEDEKNDDGDAYATLALAYYAGNNLKVEKPLTKDLAKAKYYLEKALEKNSIKAYRILGILYRNGDIYPKDYEKSNFYFKLAADGGDRIAQYNIGYNFLHGINIDPDEIKGIYYLDLASNNDHAKSQLILGKYYLTKNEIIKASYYLTRASLNGMFEANSLLGEIYYTTNYNFQNFTKAFIYNVILTFQYQGYIKGTLNASASISKFRLGLCYYYGKGVNKNLEKAKSWFKLSSDIGFVEADDYIALINKELFEYETEDTFSIGANKDVFISWNHNDLELKNKIVDFFEEKGVISCWHSDRDANGDINVSIKNAIKNSKAYVVLLTKNSIKSKWVNQEVAYILELLAEGKITKNVIKPIIYNLSDEDLFKLKMESQSSFGKLIESISCIFVNGTDLNLDLIYDSFSIVLKNNLLDLYIEKLKVNNNGFNIFIEKSVHACNDKIFKMYLSLDDNFIPRTILDYENNQIELNDILRNDISVILGEMGCGKSLLLKKLIQANHDMVFFYLKAKKLAEYLINTNKGIMDYLKKLFTEIIDLEHNKLIDELFNYLFLGCKNKVAVLIDGVDEVNNDIYLSDFISKLNLFINNYQKVKYIFTSRSENTIVNSIGYKIKYYNIQKISDKDIELIYENISRMNKKDDEELKYKFFVDLKTIDDEIKYNPLFLSNLIIIYLRENKMPKNKYMLANTSVGILVESIKNNKDYFMLDKQIKNNFNKILEGVAFLTVKFSLEHKQVTLNDILLIVLENLGLIDNLENNVNEINEYLVRRSIIIDNDFYHIFFRDYLSSKYLYDEIYISKIDSLYNKLLLLKEISKDKTYLEEYTKRYFSKLEWINICEFIILKLDNELKLIYNDKEIIEQTLNVLKDNNVNSTLKRDIQLFNLYNSYIKEYARNLFND